MSEDTIGFPLPRFVKGYACLTPGDIELAEKGTDPARPRSEATAPKERAPAQQPAAIDPQRLDAARQAAEKRSSQVVGYTPEAPRTAKVETGTVFSVSA